jgi:tRNA A-37 threonylcarbamoyl transferase component Bud32
MATVYRARDRRLGREVAVKIIHRHLRENREVALRFDSEARAVAKLKHPNIVEVYDVSDPDEDERYLVVELVPGTTLRKLLTTETRLPVEVAAALGVELAEALEHAHSLGVVHRDVKPENVLIRAMEDERDLAPVKITDFGIAKLLDAQGVTSTGQVLGSPAHMAPEQIEGGDVTGRADVFGLGVLLYEAMVGRLPFDGKNPAQVLRRVLDGTFTPADRAEPTVGVAYAAILARALAHLTQNRYASAAELALELRAELLGFGIEHPAREIQAFLSDPAHYRREHEAKVVARLREQARALRESRDIPGAAACYNRALAYRPDDAELIGAASTLSRSAKTRRIAERAVGTLVGIAAVAGVVVAVARLSQRQPPHPAEIKKPDASAAVPVAATALAKDRASAEAVAQGPAPPVRRAPRSIPRQPPPEAAPSIADGVGRVRVVLAGPASATVRIDGAEVPWFGKVHELTPGEHSFEFVAPNEQCCERGKTIRVRVPVSEGPDDVQVVQGRIEFRPATLDLRGPPGSAASCGPLGEFPVPSQRLIPMTSAERGVSCKLLPPPGSTEPPKEFDVTLRPGRLSTNLGQ